MIHGNSLLAFYQGEDDQFPKRTLAVLKAIRSLKVATDREVMKALGFEDPNAVRPRITDALKAGLLVECGSRSCPITGKTVRLVALARDPRKPQAEFSFGIEERKAS